MNNASKIARIVMTHCTRLRRGVLTWRWTGNYGNANNNSRQRGVTTVVDEMG
jgi:hypothetical protein